MKGLLLAAAVMAAASPASAIARELTPEARLEPRNATVVRAAFDRRAAGGTRFFDEVLAPDVVWTIEGSGPAAGVYRGRSGFLARAAAPLARLLATPVRPLVDAIWADGDHAIVW